MAYRHRIGDTLYFPFTCWDDFGELVELGVDVEALGVVQHASGALFREIAPRYADQQTHRGNGSIAADTTGWPAEDLTVIIEFSKNDRALVSGAGPFHLAMLADISVGDPDVPGAINPIIGPIETIWDDCKAVLGVDKATTSLVSRSRDPGDKRPIHVFWATPMPEGMQIGTIEWLGYDNISGANGFYFVTEGAKRPTIDRANNIIDVYPVCNPAFRQAKVYSTKFLAVPGMRISLWDMDGNPTGDTLEQSFPHWVEQR